ncbi:MAG: hypothetical protein GWN07_21395, partial [Actinobacteria bacterium]|nr:hypothetical protein [Actinomycetota bacterium]
QEGRAFRSSDDANAPPVAVVSRAWAERHHPGASPVGSQLVSGGCRPPRCPPTTIVGVVGDVKFMGLEGGGEGV